MQRSPRAERTFRAHCLTPAVQRLPSKNDMAFQVAAATNTQEVCLKSIHTIWRVLQGKSEGTKARARAKAKEEEKITGKAYS